MSFNNVDTVSPLRVKLEAHVSNDMLVHMPGIHCHMHEFSTSGCAFVYIIVHYCIEYRVQYLYFKPRVSRSQCKSRGEVAGTTVLFKVLYNKI